MNVYYNPEEFDLTIIVDIYCALGYEFDQFVVWQGKHDHYYWAHDSGCSCPVPFEDYHLGNLPNGNLLGCVLAIEEWLLHPIYGSRERLDAVEASRTELEPLLAEAHRQYGYGKTFADLIATWNLRHGTD